MKFKWLLCCVLILLVAACGGATRSSSVSMETPLVAVVTSAPMALLPTTTASSGGSTNNQGTTQQTSSQMKAAEIDDNALWTDYLTYREQHADFKVHDVDVSERYIISVTSEQGTPVLGAHVRVYGDNQTLLSDTRTYANGKTLFFPKSIPNTSNDATFNVVVDQGGVGNQFVLTRHQQDTWQITLTGQTRLVSDQKTRVKLDVMFLLDTTGSMGDELAQLQANILTISAQIGQLPGTPDVHYGIVAYRDRGDEYVTRIYPFTPDIQKFQSSLSALSAGGGGDDPESLNAGLHDAVHGVEWRGDDAIKLIFLVSDAPPHLDYPDDYDYAVEMREAARNGIKIYSLAASGLSAQGEYIFRQLAEYTMGHFIFITYANGSSGAPGDKRDVSVPKSDYQVELLDQLVLRLIRQEVLTVAQS